MLNRHDEKVRDDRFILVTSPSKAEGVGRALQSAFCDAAQLPEDLILYVRKLDDLEA